MLTHKQIHNVNRLMAQTGPEEQLRAAGNLRAADAAVARESYNRILEQLRREQAVIDAMHHKPWWRVGIFHRRPWRRHGPFNFGVNRYELWSWLTLVHDCADPAIGCSCAGGFRFPPVEVS